MTAEVNNVADANAADIVDARREIVAELRGVLHRLVDELPGIELHTARRYLEYLRNVGNDPVYRAFMEAPLDDEPLTPEDIEAIREGEAEIARGDTVAWEDVEARLFGDRPS